METYSLERFNAEAARFAHSLRPREIGATIVTLSGDLGAGKTAYAKAIARAYGVVDEVNSPTFVIERIYKTETGSLFERVIHIDAYRLESAHELEVLGWREIAAVPTNLIILEWPERVADLIPTEAITITLAYIDEETRSIDYGQKY